ncbi:MAG: rod shape-determining protein MreC [Nocardiopsaceae bacterium]|nr:rod shape-determining protein MreC [Nocardiopsaceae bacterium]
MLLIVAIGLITFDFRDGGLSPAHSAGGAVFGPIEQLAGDVASPFVGMYHAASGNQGSEIASLQRQNAQLRAELSAEQLDKSDSAQLKKLLQLSGRGGYRTLPARIIAAGGDYSDTVTIDAGSKDGIKPDETVLNGNGLVGIVTDVNSSTATVQLATDSASTVGVRMAGSNVIGAITGTGQTMASDNELKLTLFSATATLRPGKALVTFGSVGGHPYVAGVPVGTVQSVTSQPGSLTQTALVKPFADFTGLGVVGVVTAPPRTNPRDSVLPPKPTVPPAKPGRSAKPGQSGKSGK